MSAACSVERVWSSRSAQQQQQQQQEHEGFDEDLPLLQPTGKQGDELQQQQQLVLQQLQQLQEKHKEQCP